ncbi:MAG: sugar phosphate isomerase/epimerase family protein [Candidatus Omnitrophota bacterium]
MGTNKLKLGVITSLAEGVKGLEKVKNLGLETCQLAGWDPGLYTEENARLVKETTKKLGVEITLLWAGWPGPAIWNFVEGPITLGLVPPEYRAMRIDALKKGSDFAKMIGVVNVATHAGFIPESPNDPLYPGLVVALRDVASHCENNGQNFCFETGQETPVTLLRVFTDIGLSNLGINLDPANLLLYGKANPVDALDVIGKFVRGVHAKDGEYPTDGYNLGKEKPLGEGRVDFPRLVPKLKGFGYRGALTIEREISGEQQIKDILKARDFLTPLL